MKRMEATELRKPAPEHVEILHRRAAELARPVVVEEDAEEEVVVFLLSGSRYGIRAKDVTEIFGLREMTPLPGARPPLFGVTHWRGRILPLLDVRDLLGNRQPGVTDLSRVLVLDLTDQPFGMLADAAESVRSLRAEELRPLPDGEESARGWLRAITEDALLVLDSDAIRATLSGLLANRRPID